MLIFSMAIFVKTLAPRWYPKIAGEWIIIPPTCGNFIGFDVLTHPQLYRQLPLKTTNRDVCWNCFMILPIGSMYAISGNIYHQYTPVMLAYMYQHICTSTMDPSWSYGIRSIPVPGHAQTSPSLNTNLVWGIGPSWMAESHESHTCATRPTSLEQIHQFQFKLSPKILGRPKKI